MDWIKKPRRIGMLGWISVLVFGLAFSTTVGAQEVVDLLPYFCPACVGEGMNQRNLVGGECFYTYPAEVKGRSGFYIVKSCGDMTIYEEFAYDNNNIYHLADTSWATWNGSSWTAARCYDGRIAYSTYLNGAFGNQNGPCEGFAPHMGNEGNIWVPRRMGVGQQSNNLPTTIVAMAKDNCSCCQAQYTGPTGRWVKLVSKQPMDLGSGLGVKDVVRIAIMDGPGRGENFWYARNFGWIAFGHVDPPDGARSLYDVTRIRGVDYNGRQRQATCGGAPPVQPPGSCLASVSETRWKGEYFNNENLSGSPSMIKDDGDGFINMDWGMGGPSACNIGTDNFSVRWTRKINFPPGQYRFTMTVDDGGRLYINGDKKLDEWKLQPPTSYTAGPFALSGVHSVVFEYFERSGGAKAALTWEKVGEIPQPPSSGFGGYTGWEDGQPEGFRDAIIYSKDVVGYHNSNSPPPECSRRSGEQKKNGNYALMIAGYSRAQYAYCYYRLFDDLNLPIVNGMKLGYWIYHAAGTPQIGVDGILTDGVALRDFGNQALKDQGGVPLHPNRRQNPMNQWHYVEVDLSPAAGKTLRTLLVGFDNGNQGYQGPYRAYIDELRIFDGTTPPVQPTPCQATVPEGSWKGEYFNNKTLQAPAAMVRDDGDGPLNKEFGTNSPSTACGIGADHFSARWTKVHDFPSGMYTFTLSVDDGGRFYINGDRKIDAWKDQAEKAYTAGPFALEGRQTLMVEYYEATGVATARLTWQRTGDIPAPPSSGLFSTGFEDGQPQGFKNRKEYDRNIGEFSCQRVAGQMPRNGSGSYQIAGLAQGSYSYLYCRVFDVDIPIEQGTKLSYWIYHSSGSPKVAIDGIFDNGGTIRDFANQSLTDQRGVPIHPALRQDPMTQWYYVEVDLSKAAGRRLKNVLLAFDNGNDGRTGHILAYVDDLKIAKTGGTPPVEPPVTPSGKSKLSIQTSFVGGGPESFAFIEQAQPRVVKIIDDMGKAKLVKEKAPNTIIIGRVFIDDRLFPVGEGNPEAKALEFHNMIKGRMNGYVDYWEGLNERPVPSAWHVDWYARFEKKRVELLAAEGRKACIGNFSVGVPDVTDPAIWPAFYPAIDAAKAHGGVLCIHEYSAPTMKDGVDFTTGEGWYTLRYRKFYRRHLIPDGRVIPLVITETGVDGGILPGAPTEPGWKVYYKNRECQGTDPDGISKQAKCYFNDLVWYDSELKKDDYVLGATIFSLEIPGWDNFDIRGDVTRLLIPYVRGDGSAQPPPTQPPPSSAPSFSSGWEDSQRDGQPGVEAYRKDVIGYSNTFGSLPEAKRQSGERVYGGSYALRVSGTAKAKYAYSYHKIYQNLSLPISSGMKLSYYIYHVEGTGQIAIDGIFNDGQTLRDLGGQALKDQNHIPIHPALRRDPLGQWVYVEVDLAPAVGKVLDVLMVAFDNGNNNFQSRYLAYIDDLQIGAGSTTPPPVQPPTGITWDSRLDALNIRLEPAVVSPGQTYWRLIKGLYRGPNEPVPTGLPGGDHHIYLEVVDEQGRRLTGQRVIVKNGGEFTITIENKPAPEYGANFPMFGQLGSYSAWAVGMPSDKVVGMGMPLNHHVTYYLTFQKAVK